MPSNPRSLASSYFVETTPRAFGLLQRDRDFDHYQDASAVYERRPSCLVEPIGDWGKGMVRLVEIPSESEVNDNIVAFWVPDQAARAGETMEFSYRLRFGDLPPDPNANRAYAIASRAGIGGVSGVPNTDGSRKFVIDFAGGTLSNFPASQVDQLQVVATAAQGEIVNKTLQRVPESKVWRMVLDVKPQGSVVELSAHIAGFDQKLSETWLFQWINQ